jgi:hypothetical protein
MDKMIQDLIFEIKKLPVIDTHEHLPCEEDIVAKQADVFTRLYCHYSITNAITAGMLDDRAILKDTLIPLDERWHRFKSYRKTIELTGYARAAQIAARDLYGVDRIDDSTYLDLSRKLQEANQPGLYDSILKKACNIKKILNQGNWSDAKNGFCVSVYGGFMSLNFLDVQALTNTYKTWKDIHGVDFSSALDWVHFWCTDLQKKGIVGLKFGAYLPTDCVDDTSAENIFNSFRNNSISDQGASVLGTWLLHKAIENAPVYQFVVAIHCGIIWTINCDFGAANPMKIIPLVLKYRTTQFDLYHGGIPWVREMAVIGNQYPNVHLNLVWCHQISPFMTEHMLNEWIDLVPSNKIIAFGGDNCDGPEKTYGALQLAYENIARALAIRISRNQISEEEAILICRKWFYENPKRIYNLE